MRFDSMVPMFCSAVSDFPAECRCPRVDQRGKASPEMAMREAMSSPAWSRSSLACHAHRRWVERMPLGVAGMMDIALKAQLLEPAACTRSSFSL